MKLRDCSRFGLVWLGCFLATTLVGQDIPDYRQIQSFKFALVRIPVWLPLSSSQRVRVLEKSDFRLFVNGKPAEIESCIKTHSRPLDLVYLLDISGSMAIGGKLEGSIQLITHLMERHRSDDRWRVVVFADDQVVQVLDQDQWARWPDLKAKLRAYGKTALFDALSNTGRYFPEESHHNRAVLLFTDGNDNQSKLTRDQFLKILKTLDVPVFVVGIADGFLPVRQEYRDKLGLHTLEEIAAISGGALFLAKDRHQLPGIAESVRNSLRPQYLLTLTVERGPREKRQRIEVKVKRIAMSGIRHRTGYVGLTPD